MLRGGLIHRGGLILRGGLIHVHVQCRQGWAYTLGAQRWLTHRSMAI